MEHKCLEMYINGKYVTENIPNLKLFLQFAVEHCLQLYTDISSLVRNEIMTYDVHTVITEYDGFYNILITLLGFTRTMPCVKGAL